LTAKVVGKHGVMHEFYWFGVTERPYMSRGLRVAVSRMPYIADIDD